MTVNIFMKNGQNRIVDNFSEIKDVNSEGNVRKADINSLFVYASSVYHFVGSNTVILRGSDIEYLEIS